jgi:hypothetical protein
MILSQGGNLPVSAAILSVPPHLHLRLTEER